MKAIMENPSAYGFRISDKQLYQPRKYREVKVNGPCHRGPTGPRRRIATHAARGEPWIRSLSLTKQSRKAYTVRVPLSESLSRKKAGYKTFNPAD